MSAADPGPVPELYAARLRLRPLAVGDLDIYCAIYTDAGLMQQIGPALSETAAQRAFAAALRANSASNPANAFWVLVQRDSEAAVGLLGLRGTQPVFEAEVGAVILPSWQGQGYAAEAIAALADHAFAIPGLERLHTRHAAANVGATGLMQKLGFICVDRDADQALGVRWEMVRANWVSRGRPNHVVGGM